MTHSSKRKDGSGKDIVGRGIGLRSDRAGELKAPAPAPGRPLRQPGPSGAARRLSSVGHGRLCFSEGTASAATLEGEMDPAHRSGALDLRGRLLCRAVNAGLCGRGQRQLRARLPRRLPLPPRLFVGVRCLQGPWRASDADRARSPDALVAGASSALRRARSPCGPARRDLACPKSAPRLENADPVTVA